MAFGKNLIYFIPALFLLSCAQVGQLTGGEKDENAPLPLENQTNPPNQSINFTGKSIEITFDEYILLNNPQQTVVFVPDHAKPKTTIHKKTVRITWEEELQQNTTYVISLNGTVKDVTESNDSLMYYVFSTGSFIDSLKYTVSVLDAWTNQPVADATIGLFLDLDSIKPYYFAKSNRNGVAIFSFLKAGDYYVKAFKDENKDLKIQKHEALGFKEDPIRLDSTIVDTIPLRIYEPKVKQKITTYKFLAPNSILIGANYPIKDATFFINGKETDSSKLHYYSPDSLQLFTNVKDLSEVQLVVKTTNLSDTLSLRLTEKEKTGKMQVIPDFNPQHLGAHEQIILHVNDIIQHVDTTKFRLTNPLDSSNIPIKVSFKKNEIHIDFDRKQFKQVSLVLQKDAIQTLSQQSNEALDLNVVLSSVKDYGAIILDVSEFNEPIILELLQNSKVIQKAFLKDPSKHSFVHLLPGDYQFRVILDSNENGIWDTGNIELKQQAEKTYWFSKATKVRANWDVDLKLSPDK